MFDYWLVISLDTEEIWEACLTEDEATKKAKALNGTSGYDVTVEKVTLTKEQILIFMNNVINSDYGYDLKMFGLPEDYFKLKEREESEKETEELAEFVNIMNKMNKEDM